LVPIAVLAVAAGVYARLRVGARAVIAIALGILGVVAGIEGGYYTAKVGPSGDDYTGLLAMPAGLLLVGLGAATLWRSRRVDDPLWRRYVRRSLLAVAGLVATVQLIGGLAFGYVSTHVMRPFVPTANLGTGYEDVSFATRDGFQLEGWYIPSKNGAAVIAFPGRSGPQKHARMLADHGYGVLLFDRRGEGASDGDPNAFGWVGDRDLHAAAAYLRSRPDVDPERIGAIGLSVGGEMLIHAAAHSDAFKAIVPKGASGQSVRDGLANGDRFQYLGGGVNTVATALFTNTLPPPSLKSEVAKIAPNAVFFIYGENGQGGTEAKPNEIFYAAAREPKQIWEVPGGQHIAGITTQPEEYERRVIGFFDDALLGSE
jgi:uncharacterized protein